MTNINLKTNEKEGSDYKFKVILEDKGSTTKHKVQFTEQYYATLTDKNVDPEDLVRQSFKFLLAREDKTAILPKFNLKKIQDYFPNYEDKMKGIFT